MIDILGYLGAIVIGISLGLIGGGGSILTVPILVYMFGIVPVVATGYSLFVVGVTSFIGSMRYLRQKRVSLKTALIFGLPAIVTVYFTRSWLLPALPDVFVTVGNFDLTKNIGLMLLFALLMIAASYSMIRKDNVQRSESLKPGLLSYLLVLIEGMVVGTLTGLVGAGGGFLIVPALVLLSGLTMKLAVGTSLLIIAVKSLIGFLGDLSGSTGIEWPFLLGFTGLAVVGIIIGNYLSKFIPGSKLKPAFGWFILIMGVYIIGKELSYENFY